VSTAPVPLAPPDWDRTQRVALVTAVAGAVVFAALAAALILAGGLRPVQLFLSYLVAWTVWLAVAMGCMVLLLIQYLTGGAWGALLRRILESAARTLPLLAILFLPLAAGLFAGDQAPYPWARPDSAIPDPETLRELRDKAPYLTTGWFLGRTVVYFACWCWLVSGLHRWSVRGEQGDGVALLRLFRVSGPGLVLYGLTITFASIDWVMSLEPFWYSTVYPVLYAAGQILSGFAFAVAVTTWLARRPPLAGRVDPRHLRDLGSLLFTFIMLWAYMQLSQFLLIWVGNLPEEIPWYLRRSRGGWQWVAWALFLFQFVTPFLLLLFRDLKENDRALGWVAVGLFAVRAVDVFWWIEPAFPHDGAPFFWLLDLAALAAVGGLWAWWFVGLLRRRPLLPPPDPFCPAEATEHA
jgi:hypothetical protein